jgi:hypothetical protein
VGAAEVAEAVLVEHEEVQVRAVECIEIDRPPSSLVDAAESDLAKAPDFAAAWSSLSLAQEVSYWFLNPAEVQNQPTLLADSAESARRSSSTGRGSHQLRRRSNGDGVLRLQMR